VLSSRAKTFRVGDSALLSPSLDPVLGGLKQILELCIIHVVLTRYPLMSVLKSFAAAADDRGRELVMNNLAYRRLILLAGRISRIIGIIRNRGLPSSETADTLNLAPLVDEFSKLHFIVMLSSVIQAAVCQLIAEEELAIKLEHLPRTGICLVDATMSNHRARQIF
jgi:hypothetical protein